VSRYLAVADGQVSRYPGVLPAGGAGDEAVREHHESLGVDCGGCTGSTASGDPGTGTGITPDN
jgi:hypothetical protein